jgi:hypothetical protein
MALSRWCITGNNRFVHSAIVSGASGSILTLVAVASMGYYSFDILRGPEQYPMLVYLPLATYCAAIAALTRVLPRKGEIRWVKLVLTSAATVIPLYLLLGYSALLAACSFGDCL